MSLPILLNLYQDKFQNQTVFHVLKSLTYFYDAEKYADPIVFDKKVTWEKVKTFLTKEVEAII